MYNRTFSITGNSKGLGATGPWKLGAGVCGNKQWHQDTLDLISSVTFQRESTHLIHAGTSAVPQTYLENNQETLKNLQAKVSALIQHTNDKLGSEILFTYGQPVYTPFCCIGIKQNIANKAGIENAGQFSDFLLAGAGIDTVDLSLVGINNLGIRLNIASPRIQGNKTPDNLQPLFSRLTFLLNEMSQGLNYSDVLKRIGITR
jgi:aspartate/methionine/tyrosine aminotransferase